MENCPCNSIIAEECRKEKERGFPVLSEWKVLCRWETEESQRESQQRFVDEGVLEP